MLFYETIFFWVAVAGYVLAFVYGLFLVVAQKESSRLYVALAVSGLACQAVAIVVRIDYLSAPPVRNVYELNMLGAWLVVAMWLVVQWKYPELRSPGLVVLAVAFLMMGFGLLSRPELKPLTPAYKNLWLYVHVFFAWFAYAAFTSASAAAIWFLLRDRPRARAGDEQADRALLERLDWLGYRLILFGFAMNAVMLVSGAIWARELWGSYWSWDAIETWSLVVWLAYGLYLHLRANYGWRGRRAAWFAALALLLVSFSFWGVNYLTSSVHSFYMA